MSLSIIIPTYNSVDYLIELIESIKKNNLTSPHEVLIGIDGCEKTKKFVESNVFPRNYFFFFFTENVGPYKIKNTLAEISKFESIFFFDSDDIMLENCLYEIDDLLKKYECVKPKFIDFRDTNNGREFVNNKKTYGEGVFGIHKKIFLSINGFEGWRCAADSDFMGRIYKMKIKLNLTHNILFHRRLHNQSLTLSKETGYASKMRGFYFKISKNKTFFGPLPTLEKADYQIFDNDNRTWSQSLSEIKLQQESIEEEVREKRSQLLESIFMSSPKEIKPKENKKIDYNSVNQTSNFKTNSSFNTAIKKAKLENLRNRLR